jgi:uncharacterized protein YbjT (DUF2867 family)
MARGYLAGAEAQWRATPLVWRTSEKEGTNIMSDEKIILVTGATGNQGGATLRHLAGRDGFKLRAMTRNLSGDAAKALAERGVEVVQGDLDDEASLAAALAGVWGVFGVQNTWEAGVKKEEEQGIRLVKKAREAGVQHFVYSSVGSAQRKTGIPHFDNKARVEEALRAAEFPSFSIVRPVFFMENLLSPWFLQGEQLVTAMKPDTKLQMIAVDDIGKFAAAAFIDSEKWKNAEVDLAGDSITMPEAAQFASEILGKPITFLEIPIEAVRQNSEDFALMLEWFESTGYSADIEGLATRWGIRPLTASQWVSKKRS